MPRADQKIIVNGDEFDRLRVNSRAKHLILKDYLPTWAGILGKFNTKINYIDCFAGPGGIIGKMRSSKVRRSFP